MKSSADDFQDMIEDTNKAIELLKPLLALGDTSRTFSILFNLFARAIAEHDSDLRSGMIKIYIAQLRDLERLLNILEQNQK